MTTRLRWIAFILAGTAAIAACRNKGEGTTRDSAGATSASPGSLEGARRSDTGGGMMKMPGMGGMMGMAMMDSMQVHMRMMDGMRPDQMKAMLPRHRQMVGNMLSQMNSEMRSMNMTATPAWNALVDSVRQDLIRMPAMNAAQLNAMMAAHSARMMRLMQMHQQMMGGRAGATKQ